MVLIKPFTSISILLLLCLPHIINGTGTVIIVPAAQTQPCKGKYDQCGGIGYTGATCCQNGWECIATSEYWAQCVPPPCSEIGQQCGGGAYQGATCCVSGAMCKYQNQWYSQCVPYRPSPSVTIG
mmetsp:Transcript_66028/g.59293  ORF Transcript_66028/g.59293 Transcript_66028/m.59293 type:complete len:125 (-) Transcript_66028:35-409(-)